MILYRYIIRELILPFLYTLAIIIFIFMMQLAVQLLQKILYKGLGIGIIIELFLVNTAWMVVLAVPMAVLVTTLMSFGRMSADSEILAIKASGQNLFYLITPVFVASLVLTLSLIFFHNLILPDANHRSASLMSDISRKKPAALIEPNILIKDFENYSIIVNEVTTSTGELRGVKIFSDIPGEEPSTTIADSGTIQLTKDEKYLQLTLFNGETHSTSKENPEEYYVAKFKKHMIFIPNVDSRLQRTERSYRGDREKSVQVLLKDIKTFEERKNISIQTYNDELESAMTASFTFDSLSHTIHTVSGLEIDSISSFKQWQEAMKKNHHTVERKLNRYHQLVNRTFHQKKMQERKISQYLVEVHKKFSVSFACIIFILIGVPLGIMAKRGGMAVGVTYSIFFFVLFWIFLIGGENLADRMIVPPSIAMWSCNIIVGIFGIILTLRMVRESTFINYEPLIKIWHKVTAKKKPSKPRRRVFSNSIIRFPAIILNKTVGILPSYLIRSFLSKAIAVFISLVIIFIVVDYIGNLKLFEAAVFSDIVLYYWYYLTWFIGIIAPIGILLASMFAMGAMAKHSELTAIKAAGISVRRLTLPMLFLGLCLSVVTFYFGERFLPQANDNRKQLQEDFRAGRRAARGLSRSTLFRGLKRNFYFFGNKNTAYRFEEFRVEPQQTRRVRREKFAENKIIERVEAENLVYNGDRKWSFLNGHIKSFKNISFNMTSFDTLTDSILKATPEEMVARIKSIDAMSYWELKDLLEKAKMRGEKTSIYQADLQFKIALPFVNFIVILLGLSITARSRRRGGAVSFGIGLGLVFTFWILSQFILALGKNETLPPEVAAWAGNAIFFIIGLVLYQRASR